MNYRIGLVVAFGAALMSLAGCKPKPPDEQPPSPPSGVTAAGGNVQNTVSWGAVSGATSYNLYWKSTSGVTKASGTRISGVTTPYAHTGLTNGTTYYYVVTAQNSAGESGESAEVSATPAAPQPPQAPGNVSAAAGDSHNTVTWSAVSGATSYNVYWQTTSGVTKANGTKIAGVTTPYIHSGLTNGTSYYYVVTALNANGESVESSEATATPGVPALTAPTGVGAIPGNAQATISWSAVPGATSYNVYTSPTSPVTTASIRTSVGSPGATLTPLTNGSPIFAAVTAVRAGSESALSSEVCAVPTAASTNGLTLYDALCGKDLDGQKWRSPLYTRSVVNAALELSARASNMESRSIQGLQYANSAFVNSAGQRVTTLRANVTVPAATASRTGNAQIWAQARLIYTPPANRLTFPGNALDLIAASVGLIDSGSGLRVYRQVVHCDTPTCNSASTTSIAFLDPSQFVVSGNLAEAPASYDTTYTVTVSLNESTGAFSWAIAGGEFGAGVSGSADPGAYLSSNASWSVLGANPLAGAGFANAQIVSRVTEDQSLAGGSAGSVTARFDNVYVGLNNGAAVLWDDFSGAGGNSGPTELSAAKWSTPGKASIDLGGGSLSEHIQVTAASTAQSSLFQSLAFSNPSAINTVQSDVTIETCANGTAGSDRVQLQGSLYNDGTSGSTPPNTNQPYSAVGDVRAFLILDCRSGQASFQIVRFDTQFSGTLISNFSTSTVPMGSAPVTGNTHTLRMSWDPVAHLVTFQVDGAAPVVVDPTTVNTHMSIAAPYVKAANAPLRELAAGVFLSSGSAGSTGSLDVKVNNVFTAP